MIPAAKGNSSAKGTGVSLAATLLQPGEAPLAWKGAPLGRWPQASTTAARGQAGRGPEAERGLTSGMLLPDTVLSEGQRHPSCVGTRGRVSGRNRPGSAKGQLALTLRSCIWNQIWQPSTPLQPHPATLAWAGPFLRQDHNGLITDLSVLRAVP